MSYFTLHRIAAYLLALGTLGHTLGGMGKTARRGPEAGPEADAVLATMRSLHFRWQGADCTWYGFWMGNGLAVSALLLLAVTVLWVLGGLQPGVRRAVLAVAWAAFGSLALLCVLGFQYFTPRIGTAFGVTALLAGVAALRWSLAD
jgi:hypothetical protein